MHTYIYTYTYVYMYATQIYYVLHATHYVIYMGEFYFDPNNQIMYWGHFWQNVIWGVTRCHQSGEDSTYKPS